MRKVIAAINMTLDGVFDHTAVIPGEDIHQHYAELLRDGGVALYGKTTYHLMEFWQTVVKNPTGNKAMDEFAVVMDKIPKIVFSHTLKDEDLAGWESSKLAKRTLEEETMELRQ